MSTSGIRIAIVFLCVVSAVYAPALKNDFALDDGYVISDNRDLDTPLHRWLFTETYFEFSRELSYRPLVTVTHWMDRRGGPLFGHVLNLLLHTAVGVCLWSFAKIWIPPRAAFWGALMFLVHPAYSEAVYVITLREDILCALFLLGSFLAAYSGGTWVAGMIYSAALFSKETAVLMPAVIAVMSVFSPFRGLVKALPAFFAAALFYAAIRFVFLPGPGFFAAERDMPWAWEQGAAWTGYLKSLAFPAVLSIDHRLPAHPGLLQIVPGIAAMVCLLVYTGIHLTRRSVHALPGTWFILFLLPVMGFIPITNPSAERYLYIPCLFLFAGISCILNRLRPSALTVVLAVLVVAPLGARTHLRGYDFRDARMLYEKELAHNSSSKTSAWALGRIEFMSGNHDRARYWMRHVLERDPLFYPVFIDLGRLERAAGRPKESELWFEAAHAAAPEDPEAILSLAVCKQLKGDTAAADELYRKAARYPPHPLGLSQRFLDFYRTISSGIR